MSDSSDASNAALASETTVGACNYCNEPTTRYIPSRTFFLCDTSVECLGKYASLLRSDIHGYISRDSLTPANVSVGPTIIPASDSTLPESSVRDPGPSAPSAAASSDAPAPAPAPSEAHSPLAEIYRWKEADDSEDTEEEEEEEESDEPVEHALLEKTCVLYQRNGDEFRVTSYHGKNDEPYLNINGSHISFEQFRQAMYDITHYDISPWAEEEEEEENEKAEDQLALDDAKRLHDEEERRLELQEFYNAVGIIFLSLFVPFLLALAVSVTP